METEIDNKNDTSINGENIDNLVPIGGQKVCTKENERQRIAEEIEAFLSRGGSIDQIDRNVMADPPRKPTSNYGGQPI